MAFLKPSDSKDTKGTMTLLKGLGILAIIGIIAYIVVNQFVA